MQVHNMLDTLTFSGCLQRIKESVFAKASKSSGVGGARGKTAASQQQQSTLDGSDADDDQAPAAGPGNGCSDSQAASATDLELSMCLCCETLMNLSAMVQQVQLRSCDEILAAGLEGCTDLLSCTKSAKVPSGSKGLGLMAGAGQGLLTSHPATQDLCRFLAAVDLTFWGGPICWWDFLAKCLDF